MATANGGDVMLQLLQGFQELQQGFLELRQGFLGLGQEVQELKQGFLGLGQEVQELRKEVRISFKRLGDRVGALEGRMESLEGRMESLEGRVGLLEGQVGTLQHSNQQILGYIKRVGKMMGKVAQDRDSMIERVDDHERRLTLLEK